MNKQVIQGETTEHDLRTGTRNSYKQPTNHNWNTEV